MYSTRTAVGNGMNAMHRSNSRFRTCIRWSARSMSLNIPWWFAHMIPMVMKLSA
jgi:hypothetical protein